MKKLIFALALGLLLPALSLAHSGGTDAAGGHHCWTDCEAFGMQIGEYHFHDEQKNPIQTYEKNSKIFSKSLAERLHGSILLQVEDNGEAWYVRSKDSMKYYMKNGDIAYQMMRFFSLGISDDNLNTIPKVSTTSEMKESASACDSNPLAKRLRGEILLQVQQNGEAWYVDPTKCRAIYLKDGSAAYEIMRFLGLGIKNQDLQKIPAGVTTFSQ